MVIDEVGQWATNFSDTNLQSSNPNRRIPVFINRYSDKVAKYIRLNQFTKDFQDILNDDVIEQLYIEDGVVTAMSIHGTIFLPVVRG